MNWEGAANMKGLKTMGLQYPGLFLILFLTYVILYCAGRTNETVPLRFDDICKTRYIWLLEPEQYGTIGVELGTINNMVDNPCVIMIRTCAYCFVRIWSLNKLPFSSSYPNKSPKSGIGDCDQTFGTPYMMIFDSYYETDSIEYFWRSTSLKLLYNTSSSSVNVVVCHFQKLLNFTLYYQVKRKLQDIHRTSGGHEQTGVIYSPHFPVGYYQNREQYTYIIWSSSASDIIQVIFDDWHVSPSSEIFFDSNPDQLLTGSDDRPVARSSGQRLQMVFNTGSSSNPGNPRMYLGFKATYHIIDSDSYTSTSTSTNCGSYQLNSEGGILSFSVNRFTNKYQTYDCVWVVQKQPGFDEILIKLISFNSFSDSSSIGNSIEIRSGLTSTGRYLTMVHPKESQKVVETSNDGFYIRLRGSFADKDSVTISYASFMNQNSLQKCHDKQLYQCSNGKCIPVVLHCDGYDHCGDESDENFGCSDEDSDWGNGYETSITVGVVVPLVVSLFVIVTVCMFFLVVRRCRRVAREARDAANPVPTVSGQVATQRRHVRGGFNCFDSATQEDDSPPTYEQALGQGQGQLNMGFSGAERCFMMPPPPPTYDEAMSPTSPNPPAMTDVVQAADSPSSTSSSEPPSQQSQNSTNSSSTSDGEWRPNVHSYSMSYSSDSEFDSPRGPSRQVSTEPENHCVGEIRELRTSVEQGRNETDPQVIQTSRRHVSSSQPRPSHKEDTSNVRSHSQIEQEVRAKKHPSTQSHSSANRKENISCAARNQNNRNANEILLSEHIQTTLQDERNVQNVQRISNEHEREIRNSAHQHQNNTDSTGEQRGDNSIDLQNIHSSHGSPSINSQNVTEMLGVFSRQPNCMEPSDIDIPRNGERGHPVPQPRGKKKNCYGKKNKPQPAPRKSRPKQQTPSNSSDNCYQYARGYGTESCDGSSRSSNNLSRQHHPDLSTNNMNEYSSDGGNHGIDSRNEVYDRPPSDVSSKPEISQPQQKGTRRYTGNPVPFNPGNLKNLKRFSKGSTARKSSDLLMRGAQSEMALNRIDVHETSIQETVHGHPVGDRFSMPYQVDTAHRNKVEGFHSRYVPTSARQSTIDICSRSRDKHAAWSSQPSLHADINKKCSVPERNSYALPTTHIDQQSDFGPGRMTRCNRIDLQVPVPQQTRNSCQGYENTGFQDDDQDVGRQRTNNLQSEEHIQLTDSSPNDVFV